MLNISLSLGGQPPAALFGTLPDEPERPLPLDGGTTYALGEGIDAPLSFSRSGDGSVWTDDGLQAVGPNEPRFDGKGALFIEPQPVRSYIPESRDLTVAGWTSSGLTRTDNDPNTLDVFGGTGSTRLTEVAGATPTVQNHRFKNRNLNAQQQWMLPSSEPCRFQVLVKPSTGAIAAGHTLEVAVTLTGNGAYGYRCTLSFEGNGEPKLTFARLNGAGIAKGAEIVPVGGGWYRLAVWGMVLPKSADVPNTEAWFRLLGQDGAKSYTGSASVYWNIDALVLTKGYQDAPLVLSAGGSVEHAAEALTVPVSANSKGCCDVKLVCASGAKHYLRDEVVTDGAWSFRWPDAAVERAVASIEIGTAPEPSMNGWLERQMIARFGAPEDVVYDAIETSGGEGGVRVEVSSLDGSGTSLNDRWKSSYQGPTTIEVPSTTYGVTPATGSAPMMRSSNLTVRGHKDYVAGKGSGLRIGKYNEDNPTVSDIVIEDLVLAPGGAVPPNNASTRDGLAIFNGDRIIVRNCTIMMAIDELIAVARNDQLPDVLLGDVFPGGIKNVLFERCFIGLAFANIHDEAGSFLHKDRRSNGEVHNYGVLVGDGHPIHDPTLHSNIRFHKCVFACNNKRNPMVGLARGVMVDNCLIYGWGSTGIAVRSPTGPWNDRMGTTLAVRGNLFQPLPGYSALGKELAILRVQGGARLYAYDNWTTDGTAFAADAEIPWDGWALVSGGENDSGDPTTDSLMRGMPFITPYTAEPAQTAAERAALYADVVDHVGTRARDASGALLPGDANATALLGWALPKLRDGTLTPIDFESEAHASAMGALAGQPNAALHPGGVRYAEGIFV